MSHLFVDEPNWEVPNDLILPFNFDDNIHIHRDGKTLRRQRHEDNKANKTVQDRRFEDFCTVKKDQLRPLPPKPPKGASRQHLSQYQTIYSQRKRQRQKIKAHLERQLEQQRQCKMNPSNPNNDSKDPLSAREILDYVERDHVRTHTERMQFAQQQQRPPSTPGGGMFGTQFGTPQQGTPFYGQPPPYGASPWTGYPPQGQWSGYPPHVPPQGHPGQWNGYSPHDPPRGHANSRSAPPGYESEPPRREQGDPTPARRPGYQVPPRQEQGDPNPRREGRYRQPFFPDESQETNNNQVVSYNQGGLSQGRERPNWTFYEGPEPHWSRGQWVPQQRSGSASDTIGEFRASDFSTAAVFQQSRLQGRHEEPSLQISREPLAEQQGPYPALKDGRS